MRFFQLSADKTTHKQLTLIEQNEAKAQKSIKSVFIRVLVVIRIVVHPVGQIVMTREALFGHSHGLSLIPLHELEINNRRRVVLLDFALARFGDVTGHRRASCRQRVVDAVTSRLGRELKAAAARAAITI